MDPSAAARPPTPTLTLSLLPRAPTLRSSCGRLRPAVPAGAPTPASDAAVVAEDSVVRSEEALAK